MAAARARIGPTLPPDLAAWALSDGKAGDEGPCVALVEALGLRPLATPVRPRPAFGLLAPWGPADPDDLRRLREEAGAWPDLLVASGRRAVPYARAVKRLSGGRAFTVILKDPRTGTGAADLIWVPAHDRLRGANVVATLTSPHGISAARLAAARASPDARVAALPRPLAAVLVGGDSRHHRFAPADVARFAAALRQLSGEASLAMTMSRRTPPGLRAAVAETVRPGRGFVWDGEGRNPYIDILALADAIVVTADSTNMVGEAAATGAPLLVFAPSGGHPKISAFLEGLARHGAVRPFAGRLEASAYEPLDTTAEVAEAVAKALGRHLASWGPAGPAR